MSNHQNEYLREILIDERENLRFEKKEILKIFSVADVSNPITNETIARKLEVIDNLIGTITSEIIKTNA